MPEETLISGDALAPRQTLTQVSSVGKGRDVCRGSQTSKVSGQFRLENGTNHSAAHPSSLAVLGLFVSALATVQLLTLKLLSFVLYLYTLYFNQERLF